MEVAQQTQIAMEWASACATPLLPAVLHDLRTPLTGILARPRRPLLLRARRGRRITCWCRFAIRHRRRSQQLVDNPAGMARLQQGGAAWA